MCIWILGGRVPVTGMLAGMNLLKPGDESVETKDESLEAGEKHNNHLIIQYKVYKIPLWR